MKGDGVREMEHSSALARLISVSNEILNADLAMTCRVFLARIHSANQVVCALYKDWTFSSLFTCLRSEHITIWKYLWQLCDHRLAR